MGFMSARVHRNPMLTFKCSPKTSQQWSKHSGRVRRVGSIHRRDSDANTGILSETKESPPYGVALLHSEYTWHQVLHLDSLTRRYLRSLWKLETCCRVEQCPQLCFLMDGDAGRYGNRASLASSVVPDPEAFITPVVSSLVPSYFSTTISTSSCALCVDSLMPR